jgi:hypothetical protein
MSLDFVRTANKLDGPPTNGKRSDQTQEAAPLASPLKLSTSGWAVAFSTTCLSLVVASKGKESVVVDNQWCIFREA